MGNASYSLCVFLREGAPNGDPKKRSGVEENIDKDSPELLFSSRYVGALWTLKGGSSMFILFLAYLFDVVFGGFSFSLPF